LKGAEKIMLTGMSAGGIAVNVWSNYLKDFVKNESKVYSVSDSGVFMNFKNFLGDLKLQKEIENLYKVANVNEPTPNSECNQMHKD